MDDQLRAAPEGAVRDRVHVADDHVGLHPRLDQRIGPAVDADQDRPEVAHVRPDDPEVALVAGAARDHERLALAEARLQRRELDALGEQAPFLAQVLQRVLGEDLQGIGNPRLLLGERRREPVRLERSAVGEARPVAEEARAADGHGVSVAELVEERRAGRVDQADAAAHEQERARVREAAGLRLGHVHDDADARLEQLLGRDAVDVLVVDDRDVAGARAGAPGSSSGARAAPCR